MHPFSTTPRPIGRHPHKARRAALRGTLLVAAALLLLDVGGPRSFGDPAATTRPAPTTRPAACPPAKAASTQPSAAALREAKNEELNGWILNLLQHYQPELYAKAITLQKSDPKKLDALLKNAVPNFRELKGEQTANPALFQAYMKNLQLSYETLELAKKLRSPEVSAADKVTLKAELTKRVSDQFDTWQQIRSIQIDELMARVEKLRDLFNGRAAKKDEMVSKRVDDLMKSTPPMNW